MPRFAERCHMRSVRARQDGEEWDAVYRALPFLYDRRPTC